MQKLNALQRAQISSALKCAMDANSHKQEHVASKLGIDQGRVSKILNGHFATYNKVVKKICKYADYDPWERVEPGKGLLDEYAKEIVDIWGGSQHDRQALTAILRGIQSLARNQRPKE